MYQDNHIAIYNQNFLDNDLPDECVQMCVTSPPYWGLRKYSGEQDIVWGGNPECEHRWGQDIVQRGEIWRKEDLDCSFATSQPTRGTSKAWEKVENRSSFCSLCGAWKGSFGLEPTPEMYIEHSLVFLREIRRVLRSDGVCFWNIGDSYWANRAENGLEWDDGKLSKAHSTRSGGKSHSSLKPKDLCLIPFRVAIAAQEDGWWVRSVIIWSKPNPMPESVTDRPTNSHEYILMLTKSARYYWDASAVRMPLAESSWARYEHAVNTNEQYDPNRHKTDKHGFTQSPMEVLTRAAKGVLEKGGRNIRSVWEFPTQPYPEAHFATFPEKLPEICIKAATPEVGCCSKCGAPYQRITKPSGEYAKYLRPHREHLINKEQLGEYLTKARKMAGLTQDELCARLGINSKGHGGMVNHFENGRAIPTPEQWIILKRVLCLNTAWDSPILEFSIQEKEYHWEKDITRHHHVDVTLNSERITLGWQPTCKCNADKVPSLVLDCFSGAGTSLWVAKRLNRRAVGYEISEEYCELAVKRNQQQVMI